VDDTPQHIKDLQLKIWLSKPPMERLRQMMENNAMLYQFWSKARKLDNGQEQNTSAIIPKKP
jgi:hypothetical protein